MHYTDCMDTLNSKLSILINYDLKKRFKAKALKEDMEISELVRCWIQEYVAKGGRVEPAAGKQ